MVKNISQEASVGKDVLIHNINLLPYKGHFGEQFLNCVRSMQASRMTRIAGLTAFLLLQCRISIAVS